MVARRDGEGQGTTTEPIHLLYWMGSMLLLLLQMLLLLLLSLLLKMDYMRRLLVTALVAKRNDQGIFHWELTHTSSCLDRSVFLGQTTHPAQSALIVSRSCACQRLAIVLFLRSERKKYHRLQWVHLVARSWPDEARKKAVKPISWRRVWW